MQHRMWDRIYNLLFKIGEKREGRKILVNQEEKYSDLKKVEWTFVGGVEKIKEHIIKECKEMKKVRLKEKRKWKGVKRNLKR